jgi:hypothetical protein
VVLLVADLAAVWRNKHAVGRMLRYVAIRRRSTESSGRILIEICRIEGQNDLLKLLEVFDAVEADEKGDGSEDSEAAVDEAPGEGDASDLTGDEGEGNNRDASNDAELKNPLVADWVAQGAEESNGEDKVSEGQPVGSVGEEWVMEVGVEESGVNPFKPDCSFTGEHRISLNKIGQPAGFLFEREGGDAAEDQSGDEEREPDANGTKKLRFAFRLLRL